jgi:transposase-like protein
MGEYNTYSTEFKKRAVEKYYLSTSTKISKIAKDIGIPESTLRDWRKQYSLGDIMTESKKEKLSINWSPEEKFKAVVETLNMSEQELGEYLRSHGLHSSDIKSWKDECLEGFNRVGRPKISEEVKLLRKEKKDLERDLNRKDKALAEMSARIIFLKKSHLIFGGNEDDESMSE